MNKKVLLSLAIALILAASPALSLAENHDIADAPTTVFDTTSEFFDTLGGIFNLLVGVFVAAAAFFLFYGGVVYLTSKGSEEKVAQAKNILIYAVVGLIVALLAWSIPKAVESFITR